MKDFPWTCPRCNNENGSDNPRCLNCLAHRQQPPVQACKHDQGKPQLSLVDRAAEEGMVRVLEFGARKYDRNNWRRGFSWNRLIDAAFRHLRAFQEGETLDPESGLPHVDHAACMIHFLSAHYHRRLGDDDRINLHTEEQKNA